jgi:glycosyltransferase involved in cell wall biosynthesis
MRILQINKFFYRRGGSEAYFFDLIKLLEQRGHEVIHFSTKNQKNFTSPYSEFFVNEINFEKREGVVRDFKKFAHSLYSLEAKKKLKKLILETKPDVAHLHNVSHYISPSIFSVLREYKIPVVQTLHDYQLICPNFKLFTEGAPCERCRKYRYWNAVVHRCIHNSRLESLAECFEMYFHRAGQFYENGVYCLVTPSKFLKNKLREWGVTRKLKIKNEKLKINAIHLPHFLDTTEYSPLFTPGDYVIYFGRLMEEKGLDALLEALAGSGIKLKIVGDGPEKNKLKIKNEKLKINVEFIEHKIGKELHDLIRGSKFVVLPSIWHENYPVSLLEAGALGKAAIGSRLGGIPEIIVEKESGFLVEPGDAGALGAAMCELWNDNLLCEEMGRRARELVGEKNSPAEHYEKLMEVYCGVVAPG